MNQLTKTPNVTEVQTYNGQSPWREAVGRYGSASFAGEVVRFNKRNWTIGRDERKASLTNPLIANMNEIWFGWTRLEDGAVTDKIIGRVADRFRAPPRESLGDEDKIGSPDDPWKFSVAMVMRNADNDLYTFSSLSKGGRDAVLELCEEYDRKRHKFPGKMPSVLLDCGSYYNKKHRTDVDVPKFKVVDWEFWDEVAASASEQLVGDVQGQRDPDDFGDQIPF